MTDIYRNVRNLEIEYTVDLIDDKDPDCFHNFYEDIMEFAANKKYKFLRGERTFLVGEDNKPNRVHYKLSFNKLVND